MGAILDFMGGVTEALTDAVTAVLAVVGLFILMAVFGLASAFVARDYWNWFVSPLGLPRVGILHAWGLIILVSVMRGFAPKEQPQDDSETVVGVLAKPLVGLALTWALGWLIVTLAGPF